jgi:Ankyrin repeats (3 copies)
VAATWVVLGAKGIEEFIYLRQRACQEGKLDAFHNGENVLPEIKYWHDYLKAVMRRSDIISAEILGLIEDQMLKEEPSDRLTSEELCKKLDGIVTNAELLLRSPTETRLKGEYELREIHGSVKQTLLSMEKARNIVKSGESESYRHDRLETNTAEGASPDENALPILLVSDGLQSIRSMKSRKTEGPLDGTSHREEVLEKELASGCFAVPAAEDEEDSSTLLANTAKGKQRMHPRADPLGPISPQRFQNNNPLSTREAQTPKMKITKPQEEHDGSLPKMSLLPGRGTTPQLLAQVSPQTAFQNPLQSSRQSALSSHPRPNPQPNPPQSSLHLRGSSRSSLPSSPSPSTAITPSNPIRPQSPLRYHPVLLPKVPQNSQTTSPISLQSPNRRSNSNIPLERIWVAIKGNDANARTVCEAILNEYENAAHYTDEKSRTPIMIAAQDNNMVMVRLFLPHSPILVQDIDGKTLLHHAVSRPSSRPETKDSLDVIDQILRYARKDEADIVNIVDNNKKSPLFYCVRPNMLETAKLLIDNGAWINPPKDSAERDVLIEAVDLQKQAMVTLLLARKADFEWSRLPKYKEIPKSIRSLLENIKPRQKAEGKNKPDGGNIRTLFGR